MGKTNNDKQEDQLQENQKQDDGRVEIFMPRAQDGQVHTEFVSVNGVNYLLPTGKASRVPREVADEIRRSWEAQAAFDEQSQKLANSAGQPQPAI